MVTISDREGLFAPAFCAFILRSVRLVAVGGGSGEFCACLAMTCAPCEVVVSVDVRGCPWMMPP